MKKTTQSIFIIGLLVAAVAVIGYLQMQTPSTHSEDTETKVVLEEKLSFDIEVTTVVRPQYSYAVPTYVQVNDQLDFDGCIWDSISVGKPDGMRMAGEIGIYPMDCFDIKFASGRKEVLEVDGYYIVAFYDTATGTTDEEIVKTKETIEILAKTFKVNTQ